MPCWYRNRWDCEREDELAGWGTSIWWFEATDDGRVLRQVEVYRLGPALRYDCDHPVDRFGALSDQLLDPSTLVGCAASQDEFERAWSLAHYGADLPDLLDPPEPRDRPAAVAVVGRLRTEWNRFTRDLPRQWRHPGAPEDL